MLRIFLCLSIVAGVASAQSSDVLLAYLLNEVKQLRQDLATMALTAQRTQLVLHRLQLQQEIARRAQQRHDQAAGRLASSERERADFSREVNHLEAQFEAEKDPAAKKLMEARLKALKNAIEQSLRDDSQARSDEADAARELRAEQAKLQELQQRLDELEKTLERLAQPQR